MKEPLAQRLRPRTLDEVCGQRHLLAPGQVFRRTIDRGVIPNMIFYGPSGVGKTTVASIIAANSGMRLYKLNGTTASTSDIKSVLGDIGTLNAANGILLYLDEIQYFNKRQQQSLLECVEQGTVTLIASTTENPYFYVYNALLSRCTVFEFKSLTAEDIAEGVKHAAQRLGESDGTPVNIPVDALEYLAQSAGGDMRKALEMLHCYSLIHDDMPCMDNDDFRRGRPSCHKQFGEATALLAADALVTAAFEVLAHAKCSAESRIEAVQLLARGGGDRGMLYGQELDKHFETVRAGEAELLNLHAHKTGALIIAAVELGCAAAGVRPDTDTRKALVRYAAELGLVFQIVDDILDVTSTTEELGKPVGSDADNDKTTFITLYGLQGAHEEAERHNAAALAALDALGPGADFLRLMAAELLERKK